MTTKEKQDEALTRAVTNGSTRNYMAIIQGFESKGIALDDIKPRENIFTYDAWKALGRQVRKGEHGVRITTFRTDMVREKKDDGTSEIKPHSRPWFSTVFHISQTEPIEKPTLDKDYADKPDSQWLPIS